MTALFAQPAQADEHARGAHQQAAQAEGQQQPIPQRPALQQRQPVPAVQHGEQPALEALGAVQPAYRPGVTLCELHEILPERITSVLEQALPELDKRLHGFARPDAVLTAPETRSSSPVRILRDETRQSSLRGLYPCGEGAGYAGGITSAALDGMLTAEAIINELSNLKG